MPISTMDGQRIPVKLWIPLQEVESQALTQLRNAANLQWARYVCAMPDVHSGVGVTIGAVVALKDAVAPNVTGVDLGCGMNAIQTSLKEEDLPKYLQKLRLHIEELIPCGTGRAHEAPHPATKEDKYKELWDRVEQAEKGTCSIEKAKCQMGSLGSGNHFIEICVDTNGYVWLMLHSGSRNFGKEVAETHARKTPLFSYNKDLPNAALGVFLKGTPEFDAYWRDMQTAQLYAKLNRELMMELLKDALCEEVPKANFLPLYISCHHNYAVEEEHFGESLIVTRKGAISARKGEMGIIPGARGRKSFIVEGLGNPESLFSASHGAGRLMSRGEAKRKYTLEDLERSSHGIECYVGKGVIDEIAEAYKKIETVMAYQADLVKPVFELRALINIKGHDDKTKQDRKESEKAWKKSRQAERDRKQRERDF